MTQQSRPIVSPAAVPIGISPTALLIGLSYGFAGAALLVTLLGAFLVYEYALGAIAMPTMLSVFSGFLLGCVVAAFAARIPSGLGLGGAALVAGACGLTCLLFGDAVFPNLSLILLGLYAAAAPAIIASPGRIGSLRDRVAPVRAVVAAGLVCLAMMAGVAAMAVGVPGMEGARVAAAAASALLLILGGFAAYRFRASAPSTTVIVRT